VTATSPSCSHPTCATGSPTATSPGHPRRHRPSRPRALPLFLPGRRARPPRLRPQDPAGRAPLRLLPGRALLPADRTPLHRGHRLPGPCRQPDPRPRDHRPLPRPPPAGPGRLPRPVVEAVRRRRDVQVGTVALDPSWPATPPTRPTAPRRRSKRRSLEILRQAAETDQHEDQLFGDARGDELPRRWPARPIGWRGCVRPRPSWRPTPPRGSRPTNSASPPTPRQPTKPRTLKPRPQEVPNPKAVANAADPDSRFLHTRNGTVQGYNAQAVTTLNQLVVAAELTDEANDVHQLEPMLEATAATLAAAGSTSGRRRRWRTLGTGQSTTSRQSLTPPSC
jgi:hypothetical protein